MEAGAPACRATVGQIADLLGAPPAAACERVMPPMTVLRRCVLAHAKANVLAAHKRCQGGKLRDGSPHCLAPADAV